MSEPVSDLETHLGYWLRMVSNQVSLAFAKRLEAKDVTVAEWVVMRELYDVETLAPIAQSDAQLLLDRDGGLKGERGKAARICLYLFERDQAVDLIRSG